MISLSHVRKSYDGGASYAVNDLSIDIEPGEVLVLLGESGCGKTTTLKMINRLVDRSSGQINVDGQDVSKTDPIQLRRQIGYVFQGIGLFPHMTVRENISIVPRLLRWKQAEIAAAVRDMLDMVALPAHEYADRLPRELSGGQQQRVGVARALAVRPSVMLMDEPFGALDPITRSDLQEQFCILQRRLEVTVVMVTHDMTEALLVADRVAVMKEGEVLGIGTPRELLTQPQHEYVMDLISRPKRQADRVEELVGNV